MTPCLFLIAQPVLRHKPFSNRSRNQSYLDGQIVFDDLLTDSCETEWTYSC